MAVVKVLTSGKTKDAILGFGLVIYGCYLHYLISLFTLSIFLVNLMLLLIYFLDLNFTNSPRNCLLHMSPICHGSPLTLI